MSNKPELIPGAPKKEGSPNRAVLRPAGGTVRYVPLHGKRQQPPRPAPKADAPDAPEMEEPR